MNNIFDIKNSYYLSKFTNLYWKFNTKKAVWSKVARKWLS